MDDFALVTQRRLVESEILCLSTSEGEKLAAGSTGPNRRNRNFGPFVR